MSILADAQADNSIEDANDSGIHSRPTPVPESSEIDRDDFATFEEQDFESTAVHEGMEDLAKSFGKGMPPPPPPTPKADSERVGASNTGASGVSVKRIETEESATDDVAISMRPIVGRAWMRIAIGAALLLLIGWALFRACAGSGVEPVEPTAANTTGSEATAPAVAEPLPVAAVEPPVEPSTGETDSESEMTADSGADDATTDEEPSANVDSENAEADENTAATDGVDASAVTEKVSATKEATATTTTKRAVRKQTTRRERAASRTANAFEEARASARDAYSKKRYADAERFYLRAAQLNPKNAGAQAGLGASRLQQQDLRGALDAYKKAASLAPKNANYWVAVGSVSQRLGQTKQAKDAYENALRVDPNNALAKRALGR
ncbi:MAG: hypothetical protein R3A47_01130 [Polyangiales bacterium]